MDLYAIRVEKIEDASAFLKVFQVYVDGEDRAPQAEPRFFLTVIAEQVGPLNKRMDKLAPLGQEILKNRPSRNASEYESLLHFTSKLMHLRPLAYMLEVRELGSNEGQTKRKGIFHWKYSEKSGKFKEDEGLITWGLYEVAMTDARWLVHLQVGKLFGTAAYFG